MSGSVGDNTARASGVIASAGGGGKILQVVGTSVTDRSTTTASTWTDFGLSQAITPTAAGSKILICPMVNISWGFGIAKVVRDIAAAGYTDITGMRGDQVGSNRKRSLFGGNPTYSGPGSCTFLDSPSYSLTDEITYKLQWMTEATVTIYRNYKADSDQAYHNTGCSILTLIEVAA